MGTTDRRRERASMNRSKPLEDPIEGSAVFALACILGLAFGIAGWVVASTVSGILVPVCSGSSLLLGALGTRSRFRALGFAGVVMGLLLLPAAIRIVRQLVGA
jgi:hypothetical protein